MTGRVIPLRFTPQMIEAIEAGTKRATRRLVGAGNSIVEPGKFENVMLETGRAKAAAAGITQIRARCQFEAGVRVVTITPKVAPRDLFWVRRGRRGGTRAASSLTLEVWAVEVARVQDMTEQDAIDEGVASRDAFWSLWESINGVASWRANPWVWIYKFTLHRMNIDELLEQGRIVK